MKILNLTQHGATAEQIVAGVVEPADAALVRGLITFDELPTEFDLRRRASALANYAVSQGVDSVMIGGAPYFMAPLERALCERGVRPLYAFSKRESVEEKQGDGSVRKVQTFRHAGFVEAAL